MKTIIWFWFQKLRKFFPWTFLGSIIWIAGFTYFMVWWATTTGETLGIPPAVRSPLSFARDKLLQNYRALSYEILRNLQKSWKSRKILWIFKSSKSCEILKMLSISQIIQKSPKALKELWDYPKMRTLCLEWFAPQSLHFKIFVFLNISSPSTRPNFIQYMTNAFLENMDWNRYSPWESTAYKPWDRCK